MFWLDHIWRFRLNFPMKGQLNWLLAMVNDVWPRQQLRVRASGRWCGGACGAAWELLPDVAGCFWEPCMHNCMQGMWYVALARCLACWPLLQVHSVLSIACPSPTRLWVSFAWFRFALVSFRRPSLCSLSFRFVDRPFALSRFVSWTVRHHRRPLRHRSLVFVLLSFRFVCRPSMLSAFIIHVCSCRSCIPLPLFDDCSLLAYTFHRFCYVNVPRSRYFFGCYP